MREHGLHGFIRDCRIGGFGRRATGVLPMSGGRDHRHRDPKGEDSPRPAADHRGQTSSLQLPGDKLFDPHLLSPSTFRLTHCQQEYLARRRSKWEYRIAPASNPEVSHSRITRRLQTRGTKPTQTAHRHFLILKISSVKALSVQTRPYAATTSLTCSSNPLG